MIAGCGSSLRRARLSLRPVRDRACRRPFGGLGCCRAGRATIYALALGVYCTSWTFFGSVGWPAAPASTSWRSISARPRLRARLPGGAAHRAFAKAQNTTSIADFVAARYGKNEKVAALVCLLAVVGARPYIALQLKAVSASLSVFLDAVEVGASRSAVPSSSISPSCSPLVLAVFAIAFGTRHIDATSTRTDWSSRSRSSSSSSWSPSWRSAGTSSTVMSTVFGCRARQAAAGARRSRRSSSATSSSAASWLAILPGLGGRLLPRQFHMAVVENRGPTTSTARPGSSRSISSPSTSS